MAIALPAIPLIVKFAEVAGIVVSGVATAAGLDKLSNKVEEYIEENPEQSQKIFNMIMPAQGLANILKNESDDGEESSEEELGIKVESDPRSTKEIVLEEVARGRGKKGLPARGNFSSKGAVDGAVSITGNVKRGLRDAGRIRQGNDPNYDPDKKGRNATHQFTQYLGIRGYPSLIFMSETTDLIMPLVGYQKPQQIELFLKMIKQGDYMIFSKSEDFEKYKKSFIPRFRG